MTQFRKVLVANRGEIAVRVIQSAKSMGYKTVAVYSDADRNALHVDCADEAVFIGPSEVSSSYLNLNAILAAARTSGADAVHPGYGFLSENTDFSRSCSQAGITFIGPDPEAIELMGNKRQAKIAMINAGVPCIPGYEGADQSNEKLLAQAREIGFPVMVKAAAGGGGRGMRQVDDEASFIEHLESARSEALNAFGSDELILEKAIVEPRHIEIQVFADQHGNCIHLGERDCSIQRRFQKVVEESPSPFMTEALRQQMGEAAVQAAKSCNYLGAGTVEFLVDKDRNFYFLEMNTRLQVEHPVTELVTGTDLVSWQLKIAAGEPLPLKQEDVSLQGHAIEVRLYAEDPDNNFMPQTGNVLRWQPPKGEGIRLDSGIKQGQNISPFYDPMLAKVIAFGSDRNTACRRLQSALEDMQLLGVTHNQHFLGSILAQPEFIQGNATTAFLDQVELSQSDQSNHSLELATLLFYLLENPQHNKQQSWSASRFVPWAYTLESSGERDSCELSQNPNGLFLLKTESSECTIELLSMDANAIRYRLNGREQCCSFVLDKKQLHLSSDGSNSVWVNATHTPAQSEGGAGDGRILAAMDGAIVDVLVQPGEQVEAGQTVIILEAMKMEFSLKASAAGCVESLTVRAGDQVKTRQCLLEIASE